MTLPLNSRLSALYDTNGTQKEFGFGFRVFFDPDNGGYGLEVRRQTADGYEVIPKSDYLVLPVEDNSAGIVRFSVAPSAGQQIYIAGKTPTIQQLVLTNFGRYSAESIETQFDFITAIIQEWLSALGEETRQRIAADQILTQYVVQRIDAFVQQINQNWDDKSQEIEDYIATIMPSFTQTLRDEIEAFAVSGMQDAIDQTLADSKAEIDDAVSRANAAATAAAIIGKLYDTPEAGVDPVTGVADGDYFNVRSPNDESYVDEYQNIGGSAVATGKSYPSSQALNAVKQEQVEQKEKIGEVAVKFLRASSLGLVKWSDIDKKPPYTATEYSDAYNNGVRIANAIKAANDVGFSEVVLETGNYPVLYPNESGSTVFTAMLSKGAIFLGGVKNMTINLGQSTLFVLYDSANKHQYNPSPSSFAAWRLAGAVITTTNCRGITFKNGRLYGDQYKRAWLSGEEQTEQTYGVKCDYNNRGIRFENLKFTGFRGDGIQGQARGNPDLKIADLTTWTTGDLDLTTGAIVEKVGAYHSAKVSLIGKPIIDNMVQIMSLAARKIAFRSSYLNVLFFDESRNVLGFTRTQQAADITLLPNTAYIQFVAYDDERTTPTVTYSSLSYGIQVHTGMSYGFYVGQDCEFYENHRGGISNLGGGLKVFGATFKNSGRLNKLGFPAYSYTTQYGINLEDTYINDLFIDRVLMDNVPSPVLSNTRNFTLTNSILKNTYFGGVGLFGASYVNISGNIFENTGINSAGVRQYGGIQYYPQESDTFVSDIRIENNTLLYADVVLNVAENPKIRLRMSNNYSYRSKFIVYGNASTRVESNTLTEFSGTGVNNRGVYISAGIVKGNLVHGKPIDNSPFTTLISEVLSDNNVVLVESETIISDILAPNSTVNIGGVFKAAKRTPLHMNAKAFNADTHNSTQDSVSVRDSIFENVDLQFSGAGSTATYPKLLVNFSNCAFKDVLFNNRVRSPISDVAVELVFTNCNFDVTNLTNLINSSYPTKINATFIDCVIKSATSKDIALLGSAWVYATEQGTRFLNITNTSANFTSVGVAKVVYDPPSLTNGVQQSTIVTLAGAKVGDNINVSFDKPLSGTRMWGEVTSANTVTVYHRNDTGAVVDVPSGTLTVKLI